MAEIRTFENYPSRMVAISVLVTISVYALGTLVLSGLGPVIVTAYLLYCAAYEIWVMKYSCINCHYYGKLCGLGRGKISAWLFPKGNPEKFVGRTMTWKTLVPDLLIVLLPLLGGIVLLTRHLSWQLAVYMAMLVTISLGGNAFVRTRIACKYCTQRTIGCPAERFFGREEAR